MHPETRNTNTGLLSLVSLGPGDFQQMTLAAQTAFQAAEVVIGYQVYIDFIRPLLSAEQEIIISPIGSEVERAEQAIKLAVAGQHVAMISSGDIGIYAMSSPVFELLKKKAPNTPEVQVYPGVSAIQAAAAKLGAPLGHDFCTISLSDLLTPWKIIERRLEAAARADFVIGFYNPRSKKRNWQLQQAIDILLAYRSGDTPAAIVRNITRAAEQVSLTTLAELNPAQVDMFTLVLVGNSQSFTMDHWIVTPRGYAGKQKEGKEAKEQGELVIEQSSPQPPSSLSPPPNRDISPITLNKLTGKLAVVIGGGPVGERKVRGLLNSGAAVSLISPEATPQLQAWVDEKVIHWQRRPLQSGDLKGAHLVFAATNQRAVNARIAEEANQIGILCNVSDKPDEGNFHVPAVHRQHDAVIAVSTTSKNPRQAQHVRDKIAGWLEET